MCTFRIKDLAGHDVSANYISSNTPMWKITLQSANGYGEWAGTFNDSGNTS
jgi:hypothetical protein